MTFRFCPQCGTPLEPRVIEERERPACPAPGCGFVHYGNPTPVVAVLPTLGETAILARNVAWPPKMFSAITGFLEAGESPEDGARRELREELGLEAVRVELIGLYPFVPQNQLLICYHVEASGELALGEEIAETKAIPLDRLKGWDAGPGAAIRDWLARRRGGSQASRNPLSIRRCFT